MAQQIGVEIIQQNDIIDEIGQCQFHFLLVSFDKLMLVYFNWDLLNIYLKLGHFEIYLNLFEYVSSEFISI